MLDKDIKKVISKCSRCALCLQNCPIYEVKKDENNTSRGLICKLLGYEKKLLDEKDVKKDLKICLNCEKCKKNCPSQINTAEIFAYKNAYFNPSKISQRLFLNLKLLPLKVLYVVNLLNFKKKSKPLKNEDMLYFKGCVAKAQHKITFLDNFFYDPDFYCCALPYLASGDMKNYLKAKKRNIELIKKAKKVVFDCASCKSAVLNYSELSIEEKNKLLFFTDLIKDKQFKLKEKSKYINKTITFHKPCHLSDEDFDKIEQFLLSIENVNYKRLEKHDICCGFGGSYFIFHPIISTKIALKKAKTIKNSKADLILTTCPSCTMGLRYNQIISLNMKKTLELRDFINQELVLI